MNIQKLYKSELQFPDSLRNFYDCPEKLNVLGNVENLRRKCIAIVGCRECTEYGRKTAELIAYRLACRGYCIVSGLARGIDTASHIGALRANGRTIAVLAHGLNKIYPKENTEIARKIVYNRGTLISEYDFDEVLKKRNFVLRNRIIAGLSDKIIVVEAKRRSGSLITANYGIEYGKDIYCVPGNVNSPNSFGTNELIKNGAQILYSFSFCNII